MKRISISLIVLTMLVFAGSVFAGNQPDKWQTFSENIVTALKSDNDGLKQSALQMIIRYPDKLWVHDATFDIYNIYRYHENEKMRQLALIALSKMNNQWFQQELRRELDQEKSPALRKQIRAILAEKDAAI